MKRKAILLIALAVLLAASGGLFYYHSRSKKNRVKDAVLSVLIAGEQANRDREQEIPLGSPKEGTPLSSPEDAPEYCRELMKETDKYAYLIYDSPDFVIVEREPLSDKKYSILYRPEHLRGSGITEKTPIGGCTLEKGKDILWLKNKKGILLWGADLSDNLRSGNKRDRVYDVSEGQETRILSLVTDTVTVMHARERLVMDTLVKTTDDNRAVLIRKTLREYLRSFNINKEEPVPVKGKLSGNTAEVIYADGSAERLTADQTR